MEEENWVFTMVMKMRKGDYYQDNIIDEWYESLPVLNIYEGIIAMDVFFGRNISITDGKKAVERKPCWPHVVCTISYPNGREEWRNIRGSSESEPDKLLNGDYYSKYSGSMRDREEYYKFLSGILSSMSVTTSVGKQYIDCGQFHKLSNSIKRAMNPMLYELYKDKYEAVLHKIQDRCQGVVGYQF